MKNWKKIIFTAVFLFIGGVFFANAQDLIILKDGNVIEARVIEISPSEIRYKRFNNLDGPTIVLPTANVVSIRYENGSLEMINDGSQQARSSGMDPNKLYFSLFLDPTGFALYGPSFAAEFTIGWFNSIISFRLPFLGTVQAAKDGIVGFGLVLNYFHQAPLGGFYVGVMAEYTLLGFSQNASYGVIDSEGDSKGTGGGGSSVNGAFSLALNAGYKFVLSSGVYFRTGGFIGYDFNGSDFKTGFIIKPDLTFGYSF